MPVLLDLIGALFVSASIMLTINYLTANMQRTATEQAAAYMLQQSALSVTEFVESDIRRAGFGAPKPSVISATDSSFTFYADLDNDGTADTVTYAAGSPTAYAALATANPLDKPLMRNINNMDFTAMNIGMTRLSFAYLDSTGTPAAALDDIRAVHLTMVLETTAPVDSQYSRIAIDKIIYPRNL